MPFDKNHLITLCQDSVSPESIIDYLKGNALYNVSVPFIDITDDEGRSALHWCIALGRMTIAQALLESPSCANPCSVDSYGSTPFLTACTNRAPIKLLELILCAASVHPGYSHEKTKSDELVGGSHAISCEWTGESPLEKPNMTSSVPLQIPAMPTLLDNSGEHIDERAFPSVWEMFCSEDMVGNNALILACSRRNVETVKFLLKYHIPVNHVNKKEQTALHRAVSSGGQDIVEILIDYVRKKGQEELKRFLNVKDHEGNTPLHYASLNNDKDMGVLLYHEGADREATNKYGEKYYDL